MPKIQYTGLINGATVKAVHAGHHETLYFHILLPAIEGIEGQEEDDDLLRELDQAGAMWAKEELMTVGFVSVFHLWERQFREFLIEQGERPDVAIPKQNRSESLVAYARTVMEYFDTRISEKIWLELRRASDVVNAFKHGPGSKFDKALAFHPEYFYSPADQRHLPIVSISKSQLESLIHHVEIFWSELPVEVIYGKSGI